MLQASGRRLLALLGGLGRLGLLGILNEIKGESSVPSWPAAVMPLLLPLKG